MRTRPARLEDVPLIAPWTADTFEWGDYVAQRLPGWVEDPDSMPMVSVDDDDRPVAVANTVLLSPTEAWLEGARVHPALKRSGLGSALNRAGTEWARGRGALVARLATEDDNTAARRQVEALGYRHTSTWCYAVIEPRTVSVTTSPMAPTGDVEAAWLYWAGSELAHAGKELISVGWRWRKTRFDDLARAASAGELYQSQGGWALVEQPEPDWMRCGWLATAPEDAPQVIEGVVSMARSRDVTELGLMIPRLAWIEETLSRLGADPALILIYTLGLS